MSKITFRAKSHPLPGGAYMLHVPNLARAHCDMASFRTHPKYGAYANSNMFPSILKRVRRDLFGDSGCIFSGREYAGVKIEPGFLHTVTIEV